VWTDNVSTDGVVTNDPIDGGAPASPSIGNGGDLDETLSSGVAAVPSAAAPMPSSIGAPDVAPLEPATYPPSAPPTAQTPDAAWQPSSPIDPTAIDPTAIQPEAKGKSPLKWIIPVAAVLAVGVLLFIVVGRGDSETSGGKFGESEGELTEDEPVYTRTISLKQGEAVRIRVEPSRRLDTKFAILVSKDVADEYADGFFNVIEDDGLFSDVDQLSDEFFTDANDLITDDDAYDDLVAVQVSDTGGEGGPDADFMPAFADGNYTIAVISNGDPDGDVRVIVEKYDDTVNFDDGFSDLDRFFSDEEFFTDEGFFSDEDDFELES
jgi:hypothetical protein